MNYKRQKLFQPSISIHAFFISCSCPQSDIMPKQVLARPESLKTEPFVCIKCINQMYYDPQSESYTFQNGDNWYTHPIYSFYFMSPIEINEPKYRINPKFKTSCDQQSWNNLISFLYIYSSSSNRCHLPSLIAFNPPVYEHQKKRLNLKYHTAGLIIASVWSTAFGSC